MFRAASLSLAAALLLLSGCACACDDRCAAPPAVVAVARPPQTREPTELAAIGAPSVIVFQPSERSLVKWVFPSQKAVYVTTGEFIREPGTKGRFRLTHVRTSDARPGRYVLVYDVYDDEAGPPVVTNRTAVFDLLKSR